MSEQQNGSVVEASYRIVKALNRIAASLEKIESKIEKSNEMLFEIKNHQEMTAKYTMGE